MSDPLQAIQNKIIKLENKIEDLRKSNKEWRDKYYNARNKLEKLEMPEANMSELEHLRIENGRLQTQLNSLKRNERASEKLLKVKKIINGW